MIRHSAWDKVGGLREQFGLLADIDLWMRLSMRWAVGYVSEPVITVRQVRPDYYPDIYEGWSWRRRLYLYNIHAVNRLAYFDLHTILGLIKWWSFRLRLSLETAKWLIYAVIKHKFYIIATSRESVTEYDLLPLRLLRSTLLGLLVYLKMGKR